MKPTLIGRLNRFIDSVEDLSLPSTISGLCTKNPGKDLGWLALVEKKDGMQYELREDRAVEIFRTVYIQLGLKNQIGTASLVFEAPREVVILTEKNYRALQSQPNA